ncbi:hypothetical protein [Kaistella antarctica]|uniref:Uncharacterized protein n=1 Tax=Kaistella antarctica TaxID=266748 RepID=A0A3S4UZP4_9FLAO|nr:hypothetical protein [Kaistella antarctica]KEY19739.1 hypothetical protein HY04_00460 [Kaistella antarctica]SEV98372.1 hypothetical protein SAMN05421765_1687 [Kaistella antarctica]VEH96611.1 Uncharacterised protein [Kaistella antarctica]
MDENNEIVFSQRIDNQNGYLTLPFNENQFKDFVSGLLGKPQTMTRRIVGSFNVYLKDLQNFHNLIDQRISQQNNGHLIQLRTKIFFSDQSSVMLSSYEELLTYNEVKPIESIGVKMSWSYLIQFADKTVPEKQEIELTIIASPYKSIIEDDDIPILYPSNGEFRILIQHTARSWASDIESLITNQIKSILQEEGKISKFIRKNSSEIGVISALIFFLGSIVGIYINTKNFNLSELEKVQKFTNLPSQNIDKKINFILNYVASNEQNFYFIKSLIFIVISLIGAIILGTWINNLANNRKLSFVVLTRKSVKTKEKMYVKSQRKTTWFFLSLVITIVCGIASNFLFKWLFS